MTIRLWGNERLVNTTVTGNQFAPVVTSLQNGGYVIAWVDDMLAVASTVKFQRYDAFGVKLGVETTVASLDGEGDQTNVSICTLSNGTFVIAHEDRDPAMGANSSQIALTRFAADGSLLGQTFNSLANLSHPVVHANGTGFTLGATLFLNATDTDPYSFMYDVSGVQASSLDLDSSISIQRTADFAFGEPSVGELATLYLSEPQGSFSSLFLKYNYTGGATGGPFEIDTSPFAFPFTNAHIAYLKNGGGTTSNYVISFTLAQINMVVVKVVTFDGATFHTPAGAVTYTSFGNAGDSAIKLLADGSFVVVWHNVAALPDIHLQQFDSDGHKMGVEMTVNTNSNEIANLPSVDQLADGRLIVSWEDANGFSDGSGSAVLQQILDPRDGIINGHNIAAVAETLVGNDSYADQIRGYAGADTIYGLAGADVLYGDDGVDYLYGGRGDDTLYGGNDTDLITGGLGADDIDGGAGVDAIYFTSSRSGVTVNLLTGEGSGGEAEGDSYFNVENIVGSAFADALTAGTAAAVLDGRGGDDTLTGTNLADVFTGGTGADTINGLGGIDRANYTGSTSAIQINLATNINTGGDALNDSLTNIENIFGSNFDDTITGNTANNAFTGYGGSDRLNGGVGADSLTGGLGSDSFVFNLGESGQSATTLDKVIDYTKGAVGVGDEFDFATALIIGGSAAAATATQADISATTAVATFAAGSGTTLADALADITARMTAATTSAGEFAFFRINNVGTEYLFISDGVNGLGTGDIVVSLMGVTSINSIDLTGGDITILA